MTDEIGATGRFDIGRVLGQTASLAGRNFIPFLLLSVIFVGLPTFATSYLPAATEAGYVPAWVTNPNTGMPFVSVIVTMVFGLVLQGALTRASIDSLSKQRMSLGAALATGLKLMFPLLGLGLLLVIGIGLGLLLLIVPGIILMVRWAVAAPALVVEETGLTAAMGRSADLTEGHRWAIFGLMLLYIVVMWVVGFGIGFSGAAWYAFESTPYWAIIVSAIEALAQSLESMVTTVATAAIYFELRRVKEGVGVTELASVFD